MNFEISPTTHVNSGFKLRRHVGRRPFRGDDRAEVHGADPIHGLSQQPFSPSTVSTGLTMTSFTRIEPGKTSQGKMERVMATRQMCVARRDQMLLERHKLTSFIRKPYRDLGSGGWLLQQIMRKTSRPRVQVGSGQCCRIRCRPAQKRAAERAFFNAENTCGTCRVSYHSPTNEQTTPLRHWNPALEQQFRWIHARSVNPSSRSQGDGIGSSIHQCFNDQPPVRCQRIRS